MYKSVINTLYSIDLSGPRDIVIAMVSHGKTILKFRTPSQENYPILHFLRLEKVRGQDDAESLFLRCLFGGCHV